MKLNRQHGFTLIEILLVVSIMGIIVSIAVGAYSDQVMSAKRTDARKALQQTATILEKCKATYGVFNNGCSIGGASIPSPEELYTVTFTTLTPSTFLLTATPVAGLSQANDTDCTSLTLDNRGQQGGFGADSDVCW